MDSTQRLTEAYRAILSDLPRHWLDRSRHHEAEFAKLSGLFLPGTSAAYGSATRRIMVVGRETRRWNVVSDAAPFLSLDDYIRRAMDKQQAHLARYLPAPLDKGASFFNLLRALAADHGGDGIAWANLFGFAWNGKSPMRWSQFPTLLEVSERLQGPARHPRVGYRHLRQRREQRPVPPALFPPQGRAQRLQLVRRLPRPGHSSRPALAVPPAGNVRVLSHPASEQHQRALPGGPALPAGALARGGHGRRMPGKRDRPDRARGMEHRFAGFLIPRQPCSFEGPCRRRCARYGSTSGEPGKAGHVRKPLDIARRIRPG